MSTADRFLTAICFIIAVLQVTFRGYLLIVDFLVASVRLRVDGLDGVYIPLNYYIIFKEEERRI